MTWGTSPYRGGASTHWSVNAKPGSGPDRPRAPVGPPPPSWRRFLLPAGLVLSALLLFTPRIGGAAPTALTYSALLGRVGSNSVATLAVDPKGMVTGTFTDHKAFTSAIPTALGPTGLDTLLVDHHVTITASPAHTSVLSTLLGFLPLILLVGFFIYTGRRASRQLGGAMGGGGIMGIGRSRAKVIDVERPVTRFIDVAGYAGVKQEINEVVDFLKNPERYRATGAVGSRGVLMVGAPGTGKTLLARAVAGEADVPFLAVTGSSFVEMFVGIGASRVRDLFADARKRGRSIIFIDEIDAIGGRRGQGFGGNDEREQTLNQLLAEMDGFDDNHDVVVLAATNRPETLDPALLRPGRFDRQVTVPLPTHPECAAILAVHARGKELGPDVDLDVTARGTPGFSGADLANLLNEAAILAVRHDRTVVTAEDLSDARDRILIGRRDGSNILLPEERHAVAVHEAGHALVAALSPNADPVAKVTILPAGMALGVTEQLPLAERHLLSESYLTDSLAVRLGGRAAELIVLGEGSTGASNDLSGATALATRMIVEFGLSPDLGPVGYSSGDPQFLGGAQTMRPQYADDTQRAVDLEVRRLLRQAEDQALRLLTDNRGALGRLIDQLLEHETIDGENVLATLAAEPGRAAAPGVHREASSSRRPAQESLHGATPSQLSSPTPPAARLPQRTPPMQSLTGAGQNDDE